MASRLDFSQIRSLYIGTSAAQTVPTNNVIVDGNVLLGTTTDTGLKLDVNGSARLSGGLLYLGNYSANPEIILQATNNSWSKINFYDNNSTEGLYIRTDGDVYGGTMTFGARWDDDEGKVFFKMFQSSAGAAYDVRVGIGTGSPQKPLEVITPASDFASVGVRGLAIGDWTGIHFGYREDNSLYRKSAIVFQRTGNAAEGDIHFLNNGAADNSSATLANSRMVIKANGNVLINTTTDNGARLQVNGAQTINGNLTISGSSSDSPLILMDGPTYRMIDMGDRTSGTANDTGYLKIYAQGVGVIDIPGNADKVYFNNGGNFLIGTTTDSGFKLRVNGTAKFDGVISADPGITSGYGTILTGYNSSFQITVNANYSGGQTNTYTPQYAGISGAGMFVMKQRNGGEGNVDVWVKQSGTDGSTQNFSTFTNILNLNTNGTVGIGVVDAALGLQVADGRGFLVGPAGASGSMYVSPSDENTVNGSYGIADDTADIWLNYRGYQDGWSYFRDTRIGNGKGTAITYWNGDTGNMMIGTTTDAGYRLDVIGKTRVYTGAASGATSPDAETALLIDSAGNQYIELRTSSASSGIMQGILFTDNGQNAFIGYKEYTGGTAGTYGEAIHLAYKDFSSSDTNNGIYFGTSNTPSDGVSNVQMFIKGNGLLGIGALPNSGWTTANSYSATQFRNASLFYRNASAEFYFGNNHYYDGTNWRYNVSTSAALFEMVSDTFAFLNAPAGTAGNAITWASRLSIQSNGNVLIGTTTDLGVPYSLQVNGRIVQYGLEFAFLGDEDKRITVFANRALTFATNDLEKMRLTNGGNLLIGTTTDGGYKLRVNGEILADDDIRILNTFALILNGTDANWRIGRNTITDSGWLTSNTLQVVVFGSSSGQGFQVVNSNGTALFEIDGVAGASRFTNALGVGVNPSGTAGRIDASNDIVAYSSSDLRLKENIKPIENALDKVKALTGVEFDWKAEHKEAHGYEGHDTGVIAQEVEEVMPTAVRTNDTGYLAVRYEKLIGLLIEAVKEQQAEIDELKKLIK